MSAAASPTGALAPPVSYPEPGTRHQDWTGLAPVLCANPEAKHLAAVARTLQWADESAERGDYLDALAWLDTVEAIGDELPEAYEDRRGSWSLSEAVLATNETHRPTSRA